MAGKQLCSEGPWSPDRWQAGSQPCTLGVKEANSILGCVRKTLASRSRKVILPLGAGEATSGVMCSVLGSPRQSDRLAGESPARTTTMTGLEHLCSDECLRSRAGLDWGTEDLGESHKGI